MRHRVQKKKMNRDSDHRKALQRNLARSLILNGSIETTLAKAKYVRPFVEKLVTKAKQGNDVLTRGRVNEKLDSSDALRVLFTDIVHRFEGRSGGYTRIVKLGFRSGDRAPVARIEWVEASKKSVKTEKVPTKKSKAKEDAVEVVPVEETN